MAKGRLLSAAMGNCVHVGGVIHFNQLAQWEGMEVVFLGPAVMPEKILQAVLRYQPTMVAVSYRLTPEVAQSLLNEFVQGAKEIDGWRNIQWVFGGTSPVSAIARSFDFFTFVSDGMDDIDDSIAFLRGMQRDESVEVNAQSLVGRVAQKAPYPLLRHHYGEPSYEKTVLGVREIAQCGVLDVISLGPDQNTQQYFFHPENAPAALDGAGGVPIRSEEEFKRLKDASQTGNYPLMRCYSGTADVIKFGEMLHRTINNTWCAVPLFWYNELDGRGTRPVELSIQEAQTLMQWHALRNIPVEVNEPHHWGLRDAHDTMSVIMAYISAYNAKKAGVAHYISQYMFNLPSMASMSMDLARVLAMVEIVETLHDVSFQSYRQTRTGLPLLSADLNVAKGQLAASTMMQMKIRPHIIHVVSFCEAESIATPQAVIESCRIVRGVIKSTLYDDVHTTNVPEVLARKQHLLDEARYTLAYIQDQYSNIKDPLTDAGTLAGCVKRGILDAPHIIKNEKFRGELQTAVIDGCCVAYVRDEKRVLGEAERLARLQAREKRQAASS